MPKKIPLSGPNGEGKFALVDDEDFAAASAYSWYLHDHGYVVTTIGGRKNRKVLFLHHLIFDNPSAGIVVDHIDGDQLNCCGSNLRFATHTQSAYNTASHRDSSSSFKGVSWHSKRKLWLARIQFDKTPIRLGFFMSELEAARAYNAAAVQYHGEFARLNIIPDDTVEPVRYRQAAPKTRSSTSKYLGVYFSARRQHWVAKIQVNREQIYLGNFDAEEAAARAYDAAAKIHHGDCAFLNFPNE